MSRSPDARDSGAATEVDRWTICHFCKKFARCERWFSRWRCTDCRTKSELAQRA